MFLRLGGCVLDCVWCDTEAVWKKHVTMTVQELFELFKEKYVEYLNKGAHLVITGGDPLMQQPDVADFLISLYSFVSFPFKTEIETEGVLAPNELTNFVDRWNVSPKLANSGMPLARRFKPETIRVHQKQYFAGRTSYKFPVKDEEDVLEVLLWLDQLKNTHGVIVDQHQIWLMPIAATREAYLQLAPSVAEWCKIQNFNFSPRLHLMLWDKATGV